MVAGFSSQRNGVLSLSVGMSGSKTAAESVSVSSMAFDVIEMPGSC